MIYAHFCERICLLPATVPSSPNHTPNGGSRLGATVACVLFNHLQTINTLSVTFILKENASLEPFVVVVSNVDLK